MIRTLFGASLGALIWAIAGLILVFSLPPDPIGYIGAALMVLAAFVAIAAVVRSPGPVTIVLGLVALIPLGLFALTLYLLANSST